MRILFAYDDSQDADVAIAAAWDPSWNTPAGLLRSAVRRLGRRCAGLGWAVITRSRSPRMSGRRDARAVPHAASGIASCGSWCGLRWTAVIAVSRHGCAGSGVDTETSRCCGRVRQAWSATRSAIAATALPKISKVDCREMWVTSTPARTAGTESEP
jgi:hypothetical protein